MKILDFFACAYVINLPERRDRRKDVEKELRTKLDLTPTPGKLAIFPAVRPDSPGNFPSIGSRGCYSSHLEILKLARQQGLANVLILEDDVLILDQFRTYEQELIKQLSQIPDWGFIYFGHTFFQASHRPQLETFTESIITAHFYGVHHSIFDRLIDFLEQVQNRPSGHPDGGPMHLDGAYNLFRQKNPDVVAWRVMPSLVEQRSSRSDIYPNAWYENIPVIKQSLTLLRSGKTVLRTRRARQQSRAAINLESNT
jgi:glycosyl transferase, family 25